MFSDKLPNKFIKIILITFLTLISCYSGHIFPPRYEKHYPGLRKQYPDSSNNRFFLKRDLTSRLNGTTKVPNTTYTYSDKFKKIGIVTKKQYEIINLLWRKTKIFVDVEITTPKYKKDNITTETFNFFKGKNPIIFSSHSPMTPQLSTPSYIEFYYSDETDGQAQKEDSVNGSGQEKKNHNLNTLTSSPNSSFIVFHIKGPLLTTKTTKQSYPNIGLPNQPFQKQLSNNIMKRRFTAVNTTYKINKIRTFTENFNGQTKPCSEKNEQYFSNYIARTNRNQEATTIYDKIKFFEIYDSNTRVPYFRKVDTVEFDNYEETDDKPEFQNVQKVLLEHVDQQSSHEHNEAKHSKKHVLQNLSISNVSCIGTVNGINSNNIIPNVTTERYNKTNSDPTESGVLPNKIANDDIKLHSYVNKSVSWSEYPFAAVYTYESLNIYCDAASISAHWLVASGACLSRINQNSLTGGRSAFVAYCGENWMQPERVAYVKYIVVHPSYHPTKQTRNYLYNIGVIQVVTSMMSACSDWAPVNIMSHQFASSQGGSEALALGWGLDRFEIGGYSILDIVAQRDYFRWGVGVFPRFHTRDFSDLPKCPLALYRGLVYSDSCPGNIAYSKAKRAGEEGLRNVHCLSLPPYSGEDRDPVHGSLLLVGGKLIALYLQEERRHHGEQSALYTGIWRLIPWVMKVAREPETEAFTVDI